MDVDGCVIHLLDAPSPGARRHVELEHRSMVGTPARSGQLLLTTGFWPHSPLSTDHPRKPQRQWLGQDLSSTGFDNCSGHGIPTDCSRRAARHTAFRGGPVHRQCWRRTAVTGRLVWKGLQRSEVNARVSSRHRLSPFVGQPRGWLPFPCRHGAHPLGGPPVRVRDDVNPDRPTRRVIGRTPQSRSWTPTLLQRPPCNGK
jgi:hypothetical protein